MRLALLSFLLAGGQTQETEVERRLKECDEKNKCHEKADCYQEKNKSGEWRPVCQCKPGYYGDGVTCEEKFTLVIELCRDQDGNVIPGALRGKNTSMLMNFWMTSDEGEEYQQKLAYSMPDVKQGESMTINYYDPINIFHINKIKVLQDNWQNICLSRLSIHQGDAFLYILRTLDNNFYEPDWSDCSNPNDPSQCVVYTWWKKKCNNKRKMANGEADACRSRFMYKHDLEANLYIMPKNECTNGEHTCDKQATCVDKEQGYECLCPEGFNGDGFSCTDIDECGTNGHNCHANASCKNTDGGFECSCDENYSGDGFNCVAKRDAVEVCKNTPLPEYVGIVNHKPRKTSRGIVYRVKCENGLNMVPTNPGRIDRLRGYKANCKCNKGGECSWVLHPNFTCNPGCPHQHIAELSVIRTWEDEREEDLHQVKLKARFKPPAGDVNGWRLLIKLGTPMPETANVRISQANIIEQNGRLMLLGNTAENGKLTANEGSLGILFKVTHLQEHEKINLLRNMKASYVGSTVNELSCFD